MIIIDSVSAFHWMDKSRSELETNQRRLVIELQKLQDRCSLVVIATTQVFKNHKDVSSSWAHTSNHGNAGDLRQEYMTREWKRFVSRPFLIEHRYNSNAQLTSPCRVMRQAVPAKDSTRYNFVISNVGLQFG